MDVEHGFEPRYEVIEGKKKLIAELKQTAKKVEDIYLAADPDREGEAICYHLQEELRDGKRTDLTIYRVMFNEITKKAIEKAFEKPGQVNINLVDAQQARRVLDRLVGYKISPLLWDKVRRGLSAGRVQTVALRVIVEREREIRAFVPQGILDASTRICTPRSRRCSPRGCSGSAIRRRKSATRRRPTMWWRSSMAPITSSSRSGRAKRSATRWRRSSPPLCSRNPRASCASA